MRGQGGGAITQFNVEIWAIKEAVALQRQLQFAHF